MAVPDQIEGSVKKPDSVRINLPIGLGLSAHGKIDHLNGSLVEGCLLDLSKDALDWLNPKKEYKALKSKVKKFMETALLAELSTHASVGLGTDCCLESKTVTGFALILEKEILHLSIFARTNGQASERPTSRMARYRQRRQAWVCGSL